MSLTGPGGLLGTAQKFRLWKTAAASSRNQRALLKNVFAKMNGFSKRDVFTAWRSFCMIRREEKSKYLTGALANARNRLEQSLAREAALRDVVTRLEGRLRSGSAGKPGAFTKPAPASMPKDAARDDNPEGVGSALASTANKMLWELNKKLVTALCKLGKTCLGNMSWSVNDLGSQQVAEVRGRGAHAAGRHGKVGSSLCVRGGDARQFLVNHLEEEGLSISASSDGATVGHAAAGDTGRAAPGVAQALAATPPKLGGRHGSAAADTHGSTAGGPASAAPVRRGRGKKFVQSIVDRSKILTRDRGKAELLLRELTAMSSDHVLIAWVNYSLSRTLVDGMPTRRQVPCPRWCACARAQVC